MKQFIPSRSIEYNENWFSRYISQYGKCAVTGIELEINDWHCHHKTPYRFTRDDSYGNLTILHKSVHLIIHLRDQEKIQVHLNEKQFKEVNELRKQCLNEAI
jgi:RNA-directed DNA polymerase